MTATSITSKGQVTIPKAIRDALNLKERDRVVFVVDGDHAIMKPIRKLGLEDLRGIVKVPVPYPGREAEREAVRAHVAAHVLGIEANEE